MVIQIRGYVVYTATSLSFEQRSWPCRQGQEPHASLPCRPAKEQRLADQAQIRYSVDSWRQTGSIHRQQSFPAFLRTGMRSAGKGLAMRDRSFRRPHARTNTPKNSISSVLHLHTQIFSLEAEFKVK